MKIFLLFYLILLLLSGCSTREDINYENSAEEAYFEYQAEQAKSDWEMDQGHQNFENYLEEEDRQRDEERQAYEDYLEEQSGNSQDGGCPKGCSEHKTGCNIKGNISYDTGVKIYHVPGQEFYTATEINPQYGERWFCTEAEARANGWRKSYK